MPERTSNLELPPQEPKNVLTNVVFKKEIKGTNVQYKSSDRSRKIAILDSGSDIVPEESKAYKVEIVRDTKPKELFRGKYIVRIINQEKETESEDVPMVDKKREKAEYLSPIEISEDGKHLYILDLELEVPECPPELEKYVPPLEKFKYLTLDRRTLEVLYKVAEAYKMKEPCLLEGEPATTKTTAIEYLAALLHQPFRRMNYNGQTDSSELIGKFVPNEGELQIKFGQLLASPELLSENSKDILKKTQEQGRGLTKVESQKIAKNEGIEISDWIWQDGHLTFSAENGCILLHDELGFGEPQVLGRGMSSLEKTPSIEVSENGGIVMRELSDEEMELYKKGRLKGIKPIHKNFRQYGATNPAETHGGRMALEPAYRDRWTSQMFVESPTAKQYKEMLYLYVNGEQPLTLFGDRTYQGLKAEPNFKILNKIPGFKKFLARLSGFQEAAERLGRGREIGRSRKEKYIYTRRGLIEFLEYLEKKTIIDRKTDRRHTILDKPREIVLKGLKYYYLDKISDENDREKIRDQMDMSDIGERTWKNDWGKIQ